VVFMKYMIDMFSGLGGASQAFIESTSWQVIRFDNNPLLKDIEETIITDDIFRLVNNYKAFLFEDIDLIWASPPCREFSLGFNSPLSKASREGIEYFPNMELLKQTIETIEEIKPKTWVIENVMGSIKYFKPLLGEPRQIIGSIVLWGNFPFINISAKAKFLKSDKDVWSTDPLRANKKAKIPIEVSTALRNTLDYQMTLEEWI